MLTERYPGEIEKVYSQAAKQQRLLSMVPDYTFIPNDDLFENRRRFLELQPNSFNLDMFLRRIVEREDERPSLHFGLLISGFTYNLPPYATVLFLACGNGEELLQARRVLPTQKFFSIEKNPSYMTAETAFITQTTMWKTDLETIDATEVAECIGDIPDLTIIRHPDPKDAFWEKLIPEYAELAMGSKKGMLVTFISEDEAKAALRAVDKEKTPYTLSKFLISPRIDKQNLIDAVDDTSKEGMSKYVNSHDLGYDLIIASFNLPHIKHNS